MIKIFFFLVSLQCSLAQSIDFDLIQYKGLDFYSTRSEIFELLGTPINTFEPNNECGFLSTAEQGLDFFTIDYERLTFTGNYGKSYLIEFIDFEGDSSVVLNYGSYRLNCETKVEDLAIIFGKEIIEHFADGTQDTILILRKESEDGMRIKMKNGKLIQMEYWSPC